MKKFNFDSFVLTTGQLIIFIFASVISCIINLLFIGNLSETTMTVAGVSISPSFIMVSIAICLELAKLFSITMRNTLEELNRKIKKEYRSKAIKRVANIWLATYLFYALLAITSAVNFSLGNLGKEDIQSSYNIQVLSQYKETYENNSKKLKELNDNLSLLDKEKFEELKNTQSKINEEYSKYESEYNNVAPYFDYYNSTFPNGFWGNIKDLTDDNLKSVVLYRERVKRELGLVNGWNRKTSLKSVIDNKYSQSSINTRFREKESAIKNEIQKLENNEKEMSKRTVTLNSLENGSYVKKTIKVDSYENICQILKEEKLNQNINAGTQISLRLASETLLKFLKKDGDITDILRISLLLILSVLVEITIFQTSPKVKLDRKSLYQFSRFLPDDFDINSFVEGLDRELELYGFNRSEKSEKYKKFDTSELIKSLSSSSNEPYSYTFDIKPVETFPPIKVDTENTETTESGTTKEEISDNDNLENKDVLDENIRKREWLKEELHNLEPHKKIEKEIEEKSDTKKQVRKRKKRENKTDLPLVENNTEDIKKETKDDIEEKETSSEKEEPKEVNRPIKSFKLFTINPAELAKTAENTEEGQENVAVNILKDLNLKKAQEAIKEVPLDKPSSINVQDFAGKSVSEPFESIASQMARAVKSYTPTKGEWEEFTKEVPMDKPDFSIVQKLSGSHLVEINPKTETNDTKIEEVKKVEEPKQEDKHIEVRKIKEKTDDISKTENIEKTDKKVEDVKSKKNTPKISEPIKEITQEVKSQIRPTEGKDDKEIKSFRLGKTTEKVKQKFMDFLDALYLDCSYNQETKKYEFTNYVMSKEFTGISEKNKQTILERLKTISAEYERRTVKILEESPTGLTSYFNKDSLEKYLTEIV